MGIAYDRTGLEQKPVRWNMHQVITVATAMGIVGVVGSFGMLLTSGLQAVLVHNARVDVRKAALSTLKDKDMTKCLYLAQGGFLDLNVNYAAGVLEGLVHFVPRRRAGSPLRGH